MKYIKITNLPVQTYCCYITWFKEDNEKHVFPLFYNIKIKTSTILGNTLLETINTHLFIVDSQYMILLLKPKRNIQ